MHEPSLTTVLSNAVKVDKAGFVSWLRADARLHAHFGRQSTDQAIASAAQEIAKAVNQAADLIESGDLLAICREVHMQIPAMRVARKILEGARSPQA